MKRQWACLVTAALSLVAIGAPARQPQQQQQPSIAQTNLKEGEMAPDFTLLDNKMNLVKLSDFRGKKTVVLAFYVLAFTSG